MKKWIILMIGMLMMIPLVDAGLTVEVPNTEELPSINLNPIGEHNLLTGLQGGSLEEYFHLNLSIFDFLIDQIYEWTNRTVQGNLTIGTGEANKEYSLQFLTNTNNFTIHTDSANDYTLFDGNIMFPRLTETGGTARKSHILYFNDTDTYIQQFRGDLRFYAYDEIRMMSPLAVTTFRPVQMEITGSGSPFLINYTQYGGGVSGDNSWYIYSGNLSNADNGGDLYIPIKDGNDWYINYGGRLNDVLIGWSGTEIMLGKERSLLNVNTYQSNTTKLYFGGRGNTYDLRDNDTYIYNPTVKTLEMNAGTLINLTANKIIIEGNATDYNIFTPAYMLLHTNHTLPVNTGGTWVNITYPNDPSEVIFNINHSSGVTNYSFTILYNGTYDLAYEIGVKDSAASPNAHIGARILQNNVEIKGSYWEMDSTKQNAEIELVGEVFADLTKDDKIVLQMTSDDTTVSVTSDNTFGDHPDTAELKIIRIH